MEDLPHAATVTNVGFCLVPPAWRYGLDFLVPASKYYFSLCSEAVFVILDMVFMCP